MNTNESNNKLNVDLIKQEAPEEDDIQLDMLEDEVLVVKSEKVSIEDKGKSTGSNTLEPDGSWDLTSEMLDEDYHVESDQNVSVKLELLHEEVDIKSEDETIQEPHLEEDYNQLDKHTGSPRMVQCFICNICNKSFSHKRNMTAHLKIHNGEKPFKCNNCKYICRRKGNLRDHLRTHTDEKPFKCNICEYSCRRKGDLRDHLRTHTDEKPFKCNICEYSCRRKGDLRDHLRTHTDEKPFKCSICEYSCRRQGDLRVHLKTHTSEKPFKCNNCECSFGQKRYLKAHLRTHTAEKLFKCNKSEKIL